ncbi:MAG TPA: MBL fold metallo-hydrolase [Gemmatimonadaceae bacterium]|nr:MBL fold metallo-hydrolase [Gemmatimonadaceae bacterium]
MTSRRFDNPWPTRPPAGHNNVVRWALAHRFRRSSDVGATTVEPATPSFDAPRAAPDALTVTWLGHSTLLVQIGGRNVLTDPVWAERASPLRFAGPRRRLPPAIALASLPPIDVVVVSHDHYDHLDLATVRQLARLHPDARWATPIGVRRLVQRAGVERVGDLAWWDATEIGPLTVTCTPAQHSSGRGVTDRNRSLWCGWSIATLAQVRRAVYFAGDTAYCPAFAEIGVRLGPFDACLLPIGAYEPRWYMRYVHMTPEEAVRGFEDLCRGEVTTSTFVPIHWGTFRIADDALDEPPRRLRAAWAARQLPAPSLAMLGHGETRRWPSRPVAESTAS